VLSLRRISLLPVGMLACAATLAAAAPAHAGLLVQDATSCSSETLSQPFTPWYDYSSYSLVPGGSFETGTPSWSLSGNASVTAGNESDYLNSPSDSQSLALPAGSSATSPSMCVGIQNPTVRLVAENTGSSFSTLGVSVVFQDSLGNTDTLPIAALYGGSSWQPTSPLPIVVNLLPLLGNGETAVALQFTPQGQGGNWHIDDVYVDPWGRS
jgi:hypothetical protein